MTREEIPDHIGRREFFPRFTTAVALFFAALSAPFLHPVSRIKKLSLAKIRAMSDGINLVDEVVVLKRDGGVEILSRRCTHLGCRLQKGEKAPLHCPCHGSEFSETGEVLHGPADKPLPKVDYHLEGEALVWRS